LLREYSTIGILTPALVVSVDGQSARVFTKSGVFARIDWDGLSWARRAEPGRESAAPQRAADVLTPGDVVHVVTDGRGLAQLAQVPEAQAALVAVDPADGAVAALVGGFDYFANKYNRAIQARRQPGSSFKPFLYSAALEHGFTPASVILDAPVVLEENGMEAPWRPENSGGQFHGPTRLREALVRSRNLVSIRLLRALGTQYAIDYTSRFGFPKASMPANLTLALGTLQTTPLELAEAFATFANGGFRVEPYFIERIEGPAGETVVQAAPRMACPQCEPPPGAVTPGLSANASAADASAAGSSPPGSSLPGSSAADAIVADGAAPDADPQARAAGVPIMHAPARSREPRMQLSPERAAPRVISAQNAWLISDMMGDVIRRGTGRRALALGRNDLAGKTGTTNDAKDAWFNGFTPNLVATVWVGFDQERSLGETEEGGRTALPVWVHFMREALQGVPQHQRPMPEGLVTLRISPDTGTLASGENPDAILETFMLPYLPGEGETATEFGPGTPASRPSSEPLF
jgi:penicillin-binding protein 1A